jgi:ATP-dependent DNA helicase RecG
VAEGREILMLETTLLANGPYTFDGRPYQRIGPTTSRMPQAEYERRLLTRSFGTHRWEEQPAVDCGMEGLDMQALDRLLDAAMACGRLERRPSSHEEALDKLRLRIEGRLVQAAVVLLARDVVSRYPQCTIRMARFRGTNKLDDFLDQRQLNGHAFQLLDEAEIFLRRHVPVAGHFEPDNWVRQDRPAYPFLALREALVNAICHRDYSIVGGAIYVAIYDDRLEITSAGVLPPGITVQDLKRVHMSVPRNATIADAFFRAGLIERWGRGTLKIVDLCREAGQPEPEFEVQAGHVVVRFRPGEYVPPTQVQHSLTDRQREILAILSGGAKWRFRDILHRLSDPPADRTLRDDLQLLRSLGLVDSGGRSVAARWWLKESPGEP